MKLEHNYSSKLTAHCSQLTAHRFLISRLSAIGDCVHALPLVCAIKDACPQAFVAWVVEGRTSALLAGHRAIDQLITVPRGWLKSPRGVWQLRQQLRSLRIDVAIDPQGLTKSAVVSWLSGAKTRIGFAGVDGRELSPWLNNVRVEPKATHVIERNLELLQPLGIASPQVRFDLPESPADAATVECWLTSHQLQGRYAVINPGAGWPSKLWPVDRFAAVARHLMQQHQMPSLVVWAPGDEEIWAKRIVELAPTAAMFAPRTSLTELAAFCRRAALFVASDTGPLHIAAAVGAPCVGLFGPMPAERNGPYGPHHVTVQKMHLTGRSRDRRNAGPESMLAISVEDVCAACDAALDRSRRHELRQTA
jgi:lipopolysaccharide heptosyltransferase I